MNNKQNEAIINASKNKNTSTRIKKKFIKKQQIKFTDSNNYNNH